MSFTPLTHAHKVLICCLIIWGCRLIQLFTHSWSHLSISTVTHLHSFACPHPLHHHNPELAASSASSASSASTASSALSCHQPICLRRVINHNYQCLHSMGGGGLLAAAQSKRPHHHKISAKGLKAKDFLTRLNYCIIRCYKLQTPVSPG